ncbi:hypothetical protein H4V99_003306 [Cryobacterium sp. CG_9.6]|nr:hypothetical protein [Cryobacterium sp. CG_9.6]
MNKVTEGVNLSSQFRYRLTAGVFLLSDVSQHLASICA